MRAKIFVLGLICFFIFAYCESPADPGMKNALTQNSGSANEARSSDLEEKPSRSLAVLEISTIPKVPVFYYYEGFDKSESIFTIVIKETNGVGGYFHSRLSYDSPSCGWSFPKKIFEPVGIVSILAKACARQRPTTMTFWLTGYDDNGYEIDIQVNIPFTFEN